VTGHCRSALAGSSTPSSSSGYRVVCRGLLGLQELRWFDQRLHASDQRIRDALSGDQLSRLQSCWNDVRVRFDHKDFLWCPRHKDGPRQFECTRLITAEQVKAVIKTIPGVRHPRGVRVRFDHKDFLWCPRHKAAAVRMYALDHGPTGEGCHQDNSGGSAPTGGRAHLEPAEARRRDASAAATIQRPNKCSNERGL
jgi:hypothetical protein